MDGLTETLAAGEYDYELFYEIKANLTRDKIRNLYNLGVRHVQPGIESLSTHVLKLMRKGINEIQNVNALRWMNYYGLEVLWNIIYGFPGETESDYQRQRQIIAQIFHLVPPTGVGRIWLERFSPILQRKHLIWICRRSARAELQLRLPAFCRPGESRIFFFRGSLRRHYFGYFDKEYTCRHRPVEIQMENGCFAFS